MSASCSCKACRACCKHLPGALSRVGDLEKLAQATWRPDETLESWASRELVASAGWLLQDTRTGQQMHVPTLALRPKADGSCRHFRAGECMIYTNAPTSCREFDTHDDGNQTLSLKLAQELGRSMGAPDHTDAGGYWALHGMLTAKGQIKTHAMIRKQRRRLERALAKIRGN